MTEALPPKQPIKQPLLQLLRKPMQQAIRPTEKQGLEFDRLPDDAIQHIMENLNFKDSMSLSLSQKWHQQSNPLKRIYLNPLKYHSARDDQVLDLLLKEDSSRLEILNHLVENPSINLAKLLDYIVKSELHLYFLDMFASNKEVLMFAAAKLGKWNILRDLIEIFKVDPGSRGNLALLIACQEGKLEIVDYLLPLVDPSTPDHLCLALASYGGQEHVVKRLLQDPRVDPTFDNYAAAIQAYTRRFERIVDLFFFDDRVDREELALALRPRLVQVVIGMMAYFIILAAYIRSTRTETMS